MPKADDVCIGAIVGKNPGSAKPSSFCQDLQAIRLDGDKLLPTVRNIVAKAHEQAQLSLPERGYIQVLNLFYLCNPDLGAAIASIEENPDARICESETRQFPWVWYVWGGKSRKLSNLKGRFSGLKTGNHFYFDSQLKQIVKKPASCYAFAKHTQGLRHDDVVPYIVQLIKNG